MYQILQSLGSGETELAEVPVPAPAAKHLLVESRASVVSAGTERMLVDFGRAGLLEKARKQPDKVRQVLDKVRTDGIGPTMKAVRSKLDQPIPLGYCNAGVVRSVGEGVGGFSPGDRVVTNGSHAEYVRVPWTLAARVPDGVPFEAAAFTPLAAIGLQGLRLARPTLGETVVVYGLGLIGLLTAQLARAHGCRVVGIDRLEERLELAEGFGVVPVRAGPEVDVAAAVRSQTGGVGADAVLLTLAATSNEPVRIAADMSRKRGRIVLVGVTGLELRREDFYQKELSFQVSCSYGPGRYDPQHEEGAVDYPLPFVRWTEARNFSAVLQLMDEGRVDPLPLVSHRIPFQDATRAYDIITGDEPGLGIVLEYPEKVPEEVERGRSVQVSPNGSQPTITAASRGVVGVIGAGNFASRVLIPALKEAGAILHTVVSSRGTSGAIAARKQGFLRASTDPDTVFSDPEIDTVVIATRHDTHAEYVLRALAAGKHVFVEKPLALRIEDVDRIEEALEGSDRILCVGFNRRFAPLAVEARTALAGRVGPLVVNVTVNAGSLPDDHWTKDPKVGGGRLIGEGCHFLDLARFLVGQPVRDVGVTSASDGYGEPIEDVSLINVAFRDGSIATIQYLANGPRGFPKERVELFWDEKAIQINNFRRIAGWGVSVKGGRRLLARQEKGHGELIRGFVDAVRTGRASPIGYEEILEVGRGAISLRGNQQARVEEG